VAVKLPLTTFAPAKVNLCLYVGSRRPDGLHEICSLFQSVTLADEVALEAGMGGDEVVCPGVTGDNLALLALERFRAKVGLDESAIRITIRKKIPVAAGLGGGSADAAAVLRLCGALGGIDTHELSGLATALGADVPSQLVPGTALVTGAGERVEPVESLRRFAGLLLHGVGRLDTSLVYSQVDALGTTRPSLSRVEQRLRKALAGCHGDPVALAEVAHNDLQPIAARLEPAVDTALSLLREEGAPVALMSGSGPAVFGLFAERTEAERAASALAGRWDGSVSVVDAFAPDYAATVSRSGSGQ
jgi:4-diphosphocytidyl-2-C-methyl-D-erythritol kinase